MWTYYELFLSSLKLKTAWQRRDGVSDTVTDGSDDVVMVDIRASLEYIVSIFFVLHFSPEVPVWLLFRMNWRKLSVMPEVVYLLDGRIAKNMVQVTCVSWFYYKWANLLQIAKLVFSLFYLSLLPELNKSSQSSNSSKPLTEQAFMQAHCVIS